MSIYIYTLHPQVYYEIAHQPRQGYPYMSIYIYTLVSVCMEVRPLSSLVSAVIHARPAAVKNGRSSLYVICLLVFMAF